MIAMILKMSAVVAGNILVTYGIWRYIKDKEIGWGYRLLLAAIYGGIAILATHFGIDYNHMMLNVRDLAPLTVGLFIDPIAGVIAGFIGGIERFIVGEYFGIGSYTRIACSVSTCLSGIMAALMRRFIFKGKKPAFFFALFIGSTMEVFHMYVVFITHRADMDMAYFVVKTCAPPMIIFTGIGLALISIIIRIDSGEWVNPRSIKNEQDVRVSQKFQFWLFVISAVVLVSNLLFSYILQTQVAIQDSKFVLEQSLADIGDTYNKAVDKVHGFGNIKFRVGESGGYELIQKDGSVLYGANKGEALDASALEDVLYYDDYERFSTHLFNQSSVCMCREMNDQNILISFLPSDEVYSERDQSIYETILADILLFTVIYILISVLVQKIVVSNLEMVNKSLKKITDGNLNEEVSVYSSSEFASLSNDINQTVNVLKTYIDAAEKRIEQELEFAKSIQEAALPQNFTFPRNDLELYASMDPAKVVGGDFYDFFFIDSDKLCLVIADVSGKGIPASLFMMKSKAIIRNCAESGKSPSEIFKLANKGLCDGNAAEMFVTVWIGIIDLSTGHMVCSNAGHEYPVLKRKDGDYELYKQKHSLVLGIMPKIPFKEYELDLNPGDSIFIYTDGVPEAIDKDEKAYGCDRLVETLNKFKDYSQRDILLNVRQDIKDFVGEADQFDDVTMLGFKYVGSTEAL